ncbi:hotdog fold thioesterase [Sphingorhabdus sp. EL138]|uniref:hotdog fold thioesterase n=1 Tax=Sphingorhabdus sp. EL138 TaxID=2073156 RepID=UPI0025CCBD3B|nr:hotdog fold thioesterase [Sphingorhabdus sp. EL138]
MNASQVVDVTVPQSIWWQAINPNPDALNLLGINSMQALLGIEVTAVGDDWLAGRMPVDVRTHQPWGRLHGGASLALAETLGSLGAAHVIDLDKFIAVGMEINANHIRPVHTGWVTGTARPESIGRTTQIWSIRITDENEKLVCISRFTIAVIPLERK